MTPRDHPRACGVYKSSGIGRNVDIGSSPRVRGLPVIRWYPNGLSGIIPARAGFTPPRWRCRRAGPDHPRACGVYLEGRLACADDAGSSPRVRGLHHGADQRRPREGIIPARAGFTKPVMLRYSRGFGSSPRVRGLQDGNHIDCQVIRIIPARAGFTGSRYSGSAYRKDHPRACGVYSRVCFRGAHFGGSSPRVRGLLTLDPLLGVQERIIPARAGFTVPWSCVRTGGRDHPRACGVYVRPACDPVHGPGSSPRVRGLRVGAGLPDGR